MTEMNTMHNVFELKPQYKHIVSSALGLVFLALGIGDQHVAKEVSLC